MSSNEDIYNQPTEAFTGVNQISQMPTMDAIGQAAPVVPRKRKISRRALIGASIAGMAGAAIGGYALEQVAQKGGLSNVEHLIQHNGVSAIFHLNGPLATAPQIGHLLRRGGFGASPEELSAYQNLGFGGAVDSLIKYQQASEDDTENRLKALNLNLMKPTDQQRWWLLRMAWTQRPLLEKMTLFWHGVLTSSFHKVGGKKGYPRIMIQNQFLRNHAFDTFDNILLGITGDPAMLFYLDLYKSRKNSPNENYARVLMALFTIGIGNYTQQAVFEAAAALTGWHLKGVNSQYVPLDHNNLTKHFLGQTGNFDYRDVIRILTNHPAAPWFICRKLFTFFVYENPSNDDLKPLVDSYVQSGHNMGQVMRTLLLSPQFSSAKAYRSRVKSPVEYTVGAYRAMNMQGDGSGLPTFPTLMGQTLFDPPNVAGWSGDKISAFWLNSGTWMTRLNYIDVLLARGTLTRQEQPSPLDIQGIVDANSIDSPEHFVDFFSSFLLDGVVDQNRRTQYIDYFSAQDTSRGNAQITLKNGQSYPLNRVRGTLYLMMASPEYQLN